MIRDVCEEDAERVCEIFISSLGYADCTVDVVRRQIARIATDPGHVTLVHVNEQARSVDGFIHAERYDTLHNEGGWNVIALAVDPGAQGRGIGRSLLESFEARAKERGGTFVRLNSSLKRTAAHAFYEHVGYTSKKTQKYFIKRLA